MTISYSNNSLKIALLLLALLAASSAVNAQKQQAPMQLGVTHIGGKYHFSDNTFLLEGAKAIQGMDRRCLKVPLSLDTENPTSKLYPFHSQWPKTKTLVDLANTDYYKSLFSMDFDTYILIVFRPERPASCWRK